MALRLKKAPRIQGPDPTEDVKPARTSLLKLPLELLGMIFEYLQEDHWDSESRKAYASVCWMLRDAAIGLLDFRKPRVVRKLTHFLRFMGRYSTLAETVQSLHLSNMALDAKLVRELTRLFPTLTSLTLTEISCSPPSPYHHPTSAVSMQLEELVICSGHGVRRGHARSRRHWSLSGMMHILSLLSPKALFELGVSFDRDYPPSNILPSVLDALSRTLAPDRLQSVKMQYDRKPSLRALSTLLERVGGNVTDLVIEPPMYMRNTTWCQFDGRPDPFDDWTLLDIRACKKLEHIELPICIRRLHIVNFYLSATHALARQRVEYGVPPPPPSLVGAGLLANYAPPSLRKITINLKNLESASTLEKMSVLNLQEFDKVVTQTRFPNLQQFELYVESTEALECKLGYRERCKAAALSALPALHALGVLNVRMRYDDW
ncbi:hypothetical protein C8T65DRAFT_826164 [Cerioporus squamosus]|nr:hypothetical protein C8T65DRAFT_826164 [Cerioporus squamosus]